MDVWVDGVWIPTRLPEMVLDRIKQVPKIPYAKNRMYASIRLITWLAQHQAKAYRGTSRPIALVSSDTVWAKYVPAALAHYCGAPRVHDIAVACETAGLVELIKQKRRIVQIRIHPDAWAEMCATGVDMTVG